LRGVEKDEFCDALLSNIYGGNERAVTAICDVAALIKDPCEDCGHYDDNTTETTILAAPTCLPKATVVYADDSGVDTGYDIAVASIVGTFIDNGKRSRTNDDAVGPTVIIALAAAKAAYAAGDACEAVPPIANAACVAAKVVLNEAVVALETIADQISFHDGGIDSSEIAATLENTIIILDQTCSMTQKLDKLLCPFGPDGATFTALRQGCDGVDQDCNGVVDECSEDKVPPSLTLRTPIPDKSFRSTDEARQFLQENVIISDDCAAEFQTSFVLLSEPNCCDCEFQVTTADERCVNENTPGATANINFIVKVDSAAPVINCGFFVQQDLFHVSGGFDPCGDLPVPFPGVNDPLHLDKRSVGQGLFKVGLWYQIEVSAVMCSNHT